MVFWYYQSSMKKFILLLVLGLLFSLKVRAAIRDTDNTENGVVQWSQRCFLLKEGNKFIKQEGDCKSRHSPCSTFKIAISLMEYNEGLLLDELHPEIPFSEAYPTYIEAWK